MVEQPCFHVVMFVVLYYINKVIQSLSLWMETWYVTIQMKAIKQYFYVLLLRILYTS